jgi:CRP-like cAMP-binding protein
VTCSGDCAAGCRPRTADAIAAEATDLFIVRRRDFVEFLQQRPAVAMRIIELLCERLRWTSERMEETVLLPVSERLARRLVALGEDYGADLSVSQEELAAFVGATRETVNRQLQVWKRMNLVELGRNRIRLIDPAALAALVTEGARE